VKDQVLGNENTNSLIIPLPSLKYADLIDKIWWKFTETDPEIGTVMPKGGILGGFVRKICTVIKYFNGDHSQSWHLPAKLAAEELMNLLNIDLCIGEHGPSAGLFLAKWFNVRYNLPWIVDFRDPVDRGQSKLIRPILLLYYKRILKTASFLMAVTPYWAELDQKRFGKKTIFLPNGFDKSHYKVSKVKRRNTIFKIVYIGSIHYSQNMDLFLRGYKQFIERKKFKSDKCRFIYRGFSIDYLSQIALELDILDYIDARSYIQREKAIKLLTESNLLVLLSIDPKKTQDPLLKKGHYPGKVFEYFGVEKPILCISDDNSVLSELIQSTKTGKIVNSEDEVCNILSEYYSNWKDQKENYFPIKKEVDKYSRINQVNYLSKLMTDII
jgi:glycosyltransferase involved in cell wall biosynthesis